MMRPSRDRLLTFQEAVRYIEKLTGQRRSVSMVYRWAHDGIGGIRLESIKRDGTQYTSIEAISRFVEDIGRIRGDQGNLCGN